MVRPEDLTLDQLLYNAVLYLVQINKREAAELLVECDLEEWLDDSDEEVTVVSLAAPHAIQFAINDNPDNLVDNDWHYESNLKRQAIEGAFKAVLRREGYRLLVRAHVQLITATEGDWREHLRKLAKGQKVTNQGVQRGQSDPVVIWNNLNFRSKAEKVIAEALDRTGVMFFANCIARLGPTAHRHNKEPDFLICCDGKWGILEVDGQLFHQEAAQDHERDRQFRQQGIKVIERFSGRRCLEDPDEVVQTFIRILQQNG